MPCAKCGGQMEETIEEATCTTGGACVWTCQACGQRYIMAGRPEWNALRTEPLGHNFVNGACTRCGAENPDWYAAEGAEIPGASSGGETKAPGAEEDAPAPEEEETACSHRWERKYEPSTCVEQGRAYRVCTECGAVEVTRTYPLEDHDYRGEITRSPTADREGLATYICRICGQSYTEPIPKLSSGQTGGGSNGTEASGTGQGSCVNHSWAYQTQPATCQAEGRYYRVCRNCGVEETIQTLSKSSHSWMYETEQATCEENGGNVRSCRVCGEREVLNTTSALGHQYTASVTQAPKMDRAGERTYTCSRCGSSYTEEIPALEGSTESPVTADPAAEAAKTWNRSRQQYTTASSPMKSFLYERSDGNFTRVEAAEDGIVIEVYTPDFQLLTADTVPMELQVFGGFYAGEGYNFLIFGSQNPNESDACEVVRVVKYSKDWERLGQASLRGANTSIPFDAGSLRCAEYGGILYVRTSHEMYQSSDGLNHQANLTFSVRESDMTITDSSYRVSNVGTGYVSHSFNQFLLVDAEGRLVALDHGDAYPRSAVVIRYRKGAGAESFTGGADSAALVQFAGETGDNFTGASVGGFGESGENYLAVLSIDGQQGSRNSTGRNVVVYAVGKDSLQESAVRSTQLTHYSPSGSAYASTPQLVKISDDRFLVLWEEIRIEGYLIAPVDTVAYAFVDGAGELLGEIRTVSATLSDCQPILADGRVVWYAGYDTLPAFYAIDAETGEFSVAGGGTAASCESAVPGENGTAGAGQQSAFRDVGASFWAKEAIQRAAEEGIVNGYQDGTFRPGNPVTSAHFNAMLARAFYPGEIDQAAGEDWWEPNVRANVAHGLLEGTRLAAQRLASGKYGTELDRPLSRYDMAQMMYNLLRDQEADSGAGLTVEEAENAIEDWEDVPETYREAVSVCYDLGLLNGQSDGNFGGENNMNRAQACVVIFRLADYLDA